MLNKNSPEPLYKQLCDILRSEISELPENSRFYSERALCEMYRVSQPVVRRALAILESEGLIIRLSSQGTFVKKGFGVGGRRAKMKIGVVSPLSAFPGHHVLSETIRGVSEIASRQKREVVILDDGNPALDINSMALKVKQHLEDIDGFIWISGIITREERLPGWFRSEPERHVFVNLLISEGEYTCVAAYYWGAQYSLTKKIISSGFKKIGYIGGPYDRLASHLRYQGMVRAMEEKGLDINSSSIRPFSTEEGYSAGYKTAMEIMGAKDAPEVIMCWSDFIANGAVSALKEKGIDIPGEVGVAGFDDRDIAVQMHPTLTTCRQPYYELGKTAAKSLFEQLDGSFSPGSSCFVPCPVILRESIRIGRESLKGASGAPVETETAGGGRR